jgi:pyruvate dehydrogenase E2 component (dihydrolipoamide acetyltransferase)
MAEVIRMPKMSDTMTEGVIATWHKKVGDNVKSGDILAEVETDKATMDMESYYDGTLLYIGVEKGQAVPVDALMAIIGKAGEDFQALLSPLTPSGGTSQSSKLETQPQTEPKVQSETPPLGAGGLVNATIIRMPKMSDTMTEGVIHSWLKKVGDKIKSGDLIAEVETDKATMEMDAYDEGTLLYTVEAGSSIKVDDIIAIIGEAGADYKALLNQSSASPQSAVGSQQPEVSSPQSAVGSPQSAVGSPQPTITNNDGRILASPLAKKLASDKGISLSDVNGSGEGGRIVKSDIDNFVPKAKPAEAKAESTPTVTLAAPVGVESSENIPLTQMRKAIARSLAESQSTAVDFQLTMEINMDKAIEARTIMNESSPVKISFNDMILKACGVALRKHPKVNSSWRDDHIKRNAHIHIGMAVAVEEGLLVPVIRFADTLPLSVLAATTKDLGGKAKNGKLQPKDWEGNTFTVSNLGMFGIEQFTSIINNPKNESCILSVGGIKEIVAVKNGQFYATSVMKITLTCDHRVVDGATGAAFLVTLKELIEEPYRLLI